MNIYDTKPVVVPTWELKLIVEMGTMQNDVWTTDTTITPFGFEVYYDNVKLEMNRGVGEYCFEMYDTELIIEHELKMVVTSNHWEHLLRCRVFVEDHDIKYIIEETGVYVTSDGVGCGSDILGCVGTMTVPILTPIYKWLLSNKQNVLVNLNKFK